jgi:molybdate transport system substrate-binding protein
MTLRFVVAWAVLAQIGGCTQSQGAPNKEVIVFAASSLTDVFNAMEPVFERSAPGFDLRLNYGGSQALRLQIEQGAPVDVFASANALHVDALEAAGRVSHRRTFAANELALIAPRDNPAGIQSLKDLSRAKRIVIGAETVPIGLYTQVLLRRADAFFGRGFARDVKERVVSKEANVRLVRAKIEMGEADAAIVYRSDAQSSTRLQVLPIPAQVNVHAAYEFGVLGHKGQKLGSTRWLEFVRSEPGSQLLRNHGFQVGAKGE